MFIYIYIYNGKEKLIYKIKVQVVDKGELEDSQYTYINA